MRGWRIRSKRLTSTLALVLLIGTSLIGASASRGQGSEPLVASGTIEARETHVAAELGGRIITLHAQEGQGVEQTQLLVTLDGTQLESALQQAQAALGTAEAELAVTKEGPRSYESEAAEAELALAETRCEAARQEWQNAQQALEDPQELEARLIEARSGVALAEQGVEGAEAELRAQEIKRDREMTGGSDLQVQAAQASLEAAQAQQRKAEAVLAQLEQMRAQPLGLLAAAHAAEGGYRVAQRTVEVARAELADVQAGPTREEIDLAEARVAQAQAQVDLLETRLSRFAVTSPIAGTVLERLLLPGEVAAPAASIMTVADLSNLTLDVYVPEAAVGWVMLGQEVEIRVDSYPHQVFVGRVARVGDEAEFTPRNVATAEERLNTFYVVEIALDNEAGSLRPGMPADARF